jgi:hypothetical protein
MALGREGRPLLDVRRHHATGKATAGTPATDRDHARQCGRLEVVGGRVVPGT